MRGGKRVLIVIGALGLAGVCSIAAEAQSRPNATRGSVKVRARLFNPFDVSRSRLTMDRFGVFSVRDPASFPIAVQGRSSAVLPTEARFPASEVAVNGDVSGGGGSVEAASASAATEETAAAPEVSEEPMAGGGSVVRPPFRPPVRSPFRPPPRPPF